MQNELLILSQELDRLLEKQQDEIVADYEGFRNLLKKICSKLGLHPTLLPLFPERGDANVINRRLYKALDKPYSTKPITKEPPWAHIDVEKWIDMTATVEELSIPGRCHVVMKYKYEIDGQEYHHTYEFEQDFMHQLVWYWSENEVKLHFSKGQHIPCMVSADNPHRHNIWTPY